MPCSHPPQIAATVAPPRTPAFHQQKVSRWEMANLLIGLLSVVIALVADLFPRSNMEPPHPLCPSGPQLAPHVSEAASG